MVVLILIIGVNSLLLGWGLAVVLGYGPTSGPVSQWLVRLGPATARVSAGPVERSAPQTPAKTPDLPPVEPTSPPPVSHDAEDFAGRPVEMLVGRLRQAVLRSSEKMAEIDAQLRAYQGPYDSTGVGRCAADVLADCEALLSEQNEAAERFRDEAGPQGTLGALAEQVELANLELSAQIETAIGRLRHIDALSDPDAAAQRLSDEIQELRQRLEDTLAEVREQGSSKSSV